MNKIDRLGWAAGVAFTAYSLRIGVRVNDEQAMDRVLEALPPGWRRASSPAVDYLFSVIVGKQEPGRAARHYSLLYDNATLLTRSMDPRDVFVNLEYYLELGVAEWARGRVFVHAGVVSWHDRAIVLPGRSMAGKSSLVAALLRAGATYYSDEFAVLDTRGRVYPYARPLSIRGLAGEPARKVRPAEFGARVGRRSLPVALIVSAEYRPGARWRPRPLSRGQAALELLANTVPTQSRPELSLRTLREATAGAAAFKTRRDEAGVAAERILRMAEQGL